jgi:hypothetical protein
MPWGPDMAAGFALAALLSDDRELGHVASALDAHALPALRERLVVAGTHEPAMRALLGVLRPELRVSAVRALPPRMRGLLARLLPAPERKLISSEARASRADFSLDEPLLAVLMRMARSNDVLPARVDAEAP